MSFTKKLILDTLKMENDLKKLISPNSFKRYLSYFDLSLFLKLRSNWMKHEKVFYFYFYFSDHKTANMI